MQNLQIRWQIMRYVCSLAVLSILLSAFICKAQDDCYDGKNPPAVPQATCVVEELAEMTTFTRWRCTCSEGYSLEHPLNNLVFCYADNKTSTAKFPICRRSCITPKPFEGRWINVPMGQVVLHGESVIERCSYPPPGMKPVRILTCRDGYWQSLWMSTSCAIQMCETKPLMAHTYSKCLRPAENNTNAEMHPIGSTRTTQCFEGGKAVYWCQERFKPATDSHKTGYATCGYGGKWSPILPHEFHCVPAAASLPTSSSSFTSVVVIIFFTINFQNF